MSSIRAPPFPLVPGRIKRVGPGASFQWNVHGSPTDNADAHHSSPALVLRAEASGSSPTPPPRHLASRVVVPRLPESLTETTEQKDSPESSAPKSAPKHEDADAPKEAESRLESILSAPNVNLEALRGAAWSGVPAGDRGMVWKLLLGYLPTNAARREDALERKRRVYREAVAQHYGEGRERSEDEEAIHRQISVDVPRTCPGLALFHVSEVQQALTRMLYVWAVRHPASSYVQGMNDLATPFIFAFLCEEVDDESTLLARSNLDGIATMDDVEADSYWCLTALLDNIHDYYTFAQPGIQKRVFYMSELISRVDSALRDHMNHEGLDFMQFAFRWMNCLLMRELPFMLIVRVWDTYISEAEGFAVFHVFVCAALLHHFSPQLRRLDFQDLVMFLQNLPTHDWTTQQVDVVLSQAYMWRTLFGSSSAHLVQRIQ